MFYGKKSVGQMEAGTGFEYKLVIYEIGCGTHFYVRVCHCQDFPRRFLRRVENSAGNLMVQLTIQVQSSCC